MYAALVEQGQASKASCAAAIGTISIESASTFRPVREAYWVYDKDPNAAYRYYSDTTKHAEYAGGPEFHGRGYLQTTHDFNYVRVLGPLPPDRSTWHDWADQLMEAGPAASAFASYWSGRDIQAMADARDWTAVRCAVHGGTREYQERNAATTGLNRLRAICTALL